MIEVVSSFAWESFRHQCATRFGDQQCVALFECLDQGQALVETHDRNRRGQRVGIRGCRRRNGDTRQFFRRMTGARVKQVVVLKVRGKGGRVVARSGDSPSITLGKRTEDFRLPGMLDADRPRVA